MSISRSRGFTLIELLVVIAIIAILVALLLPAVQQVREAARKSQCQDHLHNIAIGMMDYEASFKILPPGVIAPVGATTRRNPSQYGWGWSALILPFMEQKPLYDQCGIGTGRPMQQAVVANPSPCQAVLDVYRCPSDTAEELNDKTWSAGEPGNSTLAPASDIKAMGTMNYVAAHDHRAHSGVNWNTNMGDDNFTGAFGLNKGKRIAQLTDGTSSTIAIGERCYKLGQLFMYAGQWPGCARSVHDDCIDELFFTGRAPVNPPISQYNDTITPPSPGANPGKDRRQQALSSLHPGGAQVGLFDGQVRFLSENLHFVANGPNNTSGINSVFERLVGVGDGQPVGSF